MRELTNQELEVVDGAGIVYDVSRAIGEFFGKAYGSYADGVAKGALPVMYMP